MDCVVARADYYIIIPNRDTVFFNTSYLTVKRIINVNIVNFIILFISFIVFHIFLII